MTKSPKHLRIVRKADSTDSLLREIVQRTVIVTRSRLHLEADDLGADEFRGYVRARAAGPVRFQVQQLAEACTISNEDVNRLVERALERTVYLVVREMSRPIGTAPQVFMPVRAAA